MTATVEKIVKSEDQWRASSRLSSIAWRAREVTCVHLPMHIGTSTGLGCLHEWNGAEVRCRHQEPRLNGGGCKAISNSASVAIG